MSRLKLNKNIFVYLTLFLFYSTTVLRLNPTSAITLPRLLIPLVFIYMFNNHKSEINKFLVLFIISIPYYLFISYISPYGVNTIVLRFLLHYTIILFLFFAISALTKKYRNSFFKHIKIFYMIIILFAFFEYFSGWHFPNTKEDGSVRVFFYGQNDFSAALAIAILLLIIVKPSGRWNKLINFFFILAGMFFLYNASARLSILGVLLFLSIYLINKNKLIWGPVISIIILTGGTYIIQLATNTDFFNLLFDPIKRIFTLNPYPYNVGSVVERTNAIIFGIKEYYHSFFWGIGPGNTISMLAIPDYLMDNAKSMHNFFIQIIVETGWFALACLYLLYKVIKSNLKQAPRNLNILYSTFILSGLLILSSLSVGAFSNYFFFTVYFYGILNFKMLTYSK